MGNKSEGGIDRSQEDTFEKSNFEVIVKQLKELEKESFENFKFNSEEVKTLMYFQKINLIKELDAIVYKTRITNELCNIKDIIADLENGYMII